MKFPLILAAFIALCGAAEMQNSAMQGSDSAQNLGVPDNTGSGSAQNSKSVREPAWLKDVNLTCAKYGIDTSAHPEFRAYARLKDGSALAFASPKAMFAYFFEGESSGANFGSTSAKMNSENENSLEANSASKNSNAINSKNSEGESSGDKNLKNENFGGGNFAPALLGSVVINLDLVELKAAQLGHGRDDETALLFTHGLLHVLGFDHESDDGQMRAKECEIIEKFCLPKSLIVRTEGSRE